MIRTASAFLACAEVPWVVHVEPACPWQARRACAVPRGCSDRIRAHPNGVLVPPAPRRASQGGSTRRTGIRALTAPRRPCPVVPCDAAYLRRPRRSYDMLSVGGPSRPAYGCRTPFHRIGAKLGIRATHESSPLWVGSSLRWSLSQVGLYLLTRRRGGEDDAVTALIGPKRVVSHVEPAQDMAGSTLLINAGRTPRQEADPSGRDPEPVSCHAL
jgi:hypothetical protein